MLDLKRFCRTRKPSFPAPPLLLNTGVGSTDLRDILCYFLTGSRKNSFIMLSLGFFSEEMTM